jgi:hypothetical protein
LAELHYQFKEIPNALKRYRELKEEHPDHTVREGETSHLDLCYRLSEKMGYPLKKNKRDK